METIQTSSHRYFRIMRETAQAFCLILILGLTGVLITACTIPLTDRTPSIPPQGQPLPISPLPTARQIDNLENEVITFVHFGMNTLYDREWGDPATDYDPQRFDFPSFDARQWVDAVEAMGSHTLVIVAKHHDGFSHWPTQTDPDYSVSNTPFQRDILKDLTDELHKRNMKVGIYLSTWDQRFLRRHGIDGDAYLLYYKQQLSEVLNPTVYGRIDVVWLDGAGAAEMGLNREQFQEIYDHIYTLAPGVILQCSSPDAAWVGNEDGVSPETMWNLAQPLDWTMESPTEIDLAKVARDQPVEIADLSVIGKSHKEQAIFRPLQADARIITGWFWHPKDKVRQYFPEIYLNTVGRGTQLILNYSPNADGLIPQEQIDAANTIKAMRDATFAHNLLQGSTITVSSILNNDIQQYGGQTLLDHTPGSYWATPDGTDSAWVLFTPDHPVTGDIIDLREYLRLGQRIGGVTVEGRLADGTWRTMASATTVGSRRILRLATPVTISELRLTLQGTRGSPLLSEVGFYRYATGITASGKQ